jgi:orotate phosphoribosyltransferase
MDGVSSAVDDILHTGHFVFESGYHGDTWLDLDKLASEPRRLCDLSEQLAGRLERYGADLVCGPLEGGAFVAQWVAAALGTAFAYSRRASSADPAAAPLYVVPQGFDVAGCQAVVVDDAINLGSATLATAASLAARGCEVVAVGSPIVCVPAGAAVGDRLGVPQVWLAEVTSTVWGRKDCPHCGAG